MEELVKFILQQNRDLSAQVVELSQAIVKLVTPQPYPDPLEWETPPPAMSEIEEDARYMLETGQINPTELSDLLARAGVANPNVEVLTDD